jgi:hypothetical protein
MPDLESLLDLGQRRADATRVTDVELGTCPDADHRGNDQCRAEPMPPQKATSIDAATVRGEPRCAV